MNWKNEWKKLLSCLGGFLICFYLPIGSQRFDNAVLEAFHLVKWYAREHVLLCLIPAFFIAGAIGVFINQTTIIKYLGADAKKFLAYGVASVSGTILSVCSCTVLPLFVGIYRRGAGLGPATAFLYSGPAINLLAIVLTARILGFEMGLARAIGAISFSVLIGLSMQLIFFKEEQLRAEAQTEAIEEGSQRKLWQNTAYFATLVGILVFANWSKPDETMGIFLKIYSIKWHLTAGFAAMLGAILVLWFQMKPKKVLLVAFLVSASAIFYSNQPLIAFTIGVLGLALITSTDKGETSSWFVASWDLAKQTLPLLLLGVLLAGALLGRVGHAGLIPSEWISRALGGNSLTANFLASMVGAFMYFATLTEIPILQGLMANDMGKGPALALLLSGPALSLPNMLIIRTVLGTRKALVFIGLIILMATITGLFFGKFFE